MSRIIANNIRHNDATADSLSFDSSGNVSAPGNLSVTGTSTLTGNTTVTGSLTANGIAYPSAGPLSNRNLIINGAMQVAQRGTSHSSNGYGSLDRFTLFDDQTTVTMSQQSLASGSPYDEGFRYFLRLSNSGTSTATNAFVQIDQQIEAQNIAQSGWNYTSSSSFITVSFWARSSVAGTYYAQYRANDTSNYVYNDSFTLSANTWTKITQSIPGNSNLVFNNDNGAGLRLVIVPYYGTGYTDNSVTDETWYQQTSTTWFRDFAQNWQNTDGATFDVTGVQLEVGSVATPFEHRSYGDELAKCQRYFQQLASGELVGGKNTSTRMRITGKLITEMRTAPTTTRTSNSVGFQGVGATLSSTNTSAAQAATQGVRFMAFDLDGFPTLADRAYNGVDSTSVVFECSAEL